MARFIFPPSSGTIENFIPLPEFLTYTEGRTHLLNLNGNFGWDENGVWFGPTSSDEGEEESYPIFTNFTIPQNTSSEVSFDVEFDDECSDAGVAFYVDGTVPVWSFSPDLTRIAAQFNCPVPGIQGLENFVEAEGSLPGPGVYRMAVTYDPTAETDKVVFEVYSTGESPEVLYTLTLNEALPEGDYRIGFAADMDPGDGGRTYIRNLAILAGEDPYMDSLTEGNSGDTELGIADFVFVNEGDTSSMSLSDKDMRIETTRSDAEIDADISIISADDIFIEAMGDDITLTAADEIRMSAVEIVEIQTGAGSTWQFGNGGGLDFPGGGNVFNPTNTSGDGLGLSTFEIQPDLSVNDDRYIVIDPTTPNHIHIRPGGAIDASSADLIIGGEETSVTISDGSDLVLIQGVGGQYINDTSSENQIATIGDVGVETSYEVQGGTAGTQPTFDEGTTPLFTANYIRMSSNLVHFEIQVDMDNITSFGTGQYYMTLPFNAKYGYKFRDGCLHDISIGRTYHISGHVYAGSNVLTLYTSDTQGNTLYDFAFTSAEPITLETADNFHIAGTYIAEDIV